MPPLPSDTVALRATDIHRLLNALKRTGEPDLSILEDHFLRWFPGDARVEEERLRALVEAGRVDDAAQRFSELDPAATEGIEPWLRFQVCAHAHDSVGTLAALGDMGDFGDARIEVLVAGLGRLPTATTIEAIDLLVEDLLGDQALVLLLRGVAEQTEVPEVIAKVAELLDANDLGEEAITLLDRQLRRAFDRDLAAQALDLAEKLPGRQPLGSWALRLVEVDLQAGDEAAANAKAEALRRDLSLEQRDELVRILIANLAGIDPIAHMVESLVRDLLAAGRIEKAAGLAAVLDEVDGDMAELLVDEIRGLLQRLEPVVEYMRVNVEHRRERAANRADGMHLVIVGGEEIVGYRDELRQRFRFAQVDWLCGEFGQDVPLDKLKSAHPDTHVVVIVTDHSGHALTGKAEQLAKKSNVTPRKCPSLGKDGIETAILDHLAPVG